MKRHMLSFEGKRRTRYYATTGDRSTLHGRGEGKLCAKGRRERKEIVAADPLLPMERFPTKPCAGLVRCGGGHVKRPPWRFFG